MKTAPLAPKAPDDAHVAAKQLEAFFLRQFLAESHPSTPGMLDGGFAGDTFKQMLDGAMADKMSSSGGIGMAEMFAKQLGGKTAAAAPHGLQMPMHPTGLERPAAPSELGPEVGDAPRLIMPVVGRASSGYGMRNDPIKGAAINHPGFDLAAATGTPVSAAASGVIVHAGPAGTYGNLVTVRHDGGYETRYAHLSAVTVHEGDAVTAGQQIGNVGTTGYSTGPHLHFEIRHDGKPMDPAPLLPLNRSSNRPNR